MTERDFYLKNKKFLDVIAELSKFYFFRLAKDYGKSQISGVACMPRVITFDPCLFGAKMTFPCAMISCAAWSQINHNRPAQLFGKQHRLNFARRHFSFSPDSFRISWHKNNPFRLFMLIKSATLALKLNN